MRFCQRMIAWLWAAGLLIKLCPVGGERYPDEAQHCPLHHVQLTEIATACARSAMDRWIVDTEVVG